MSKSSEQQAVEVTDTLTEGQKDFLREAEKRGVERKLFGDCVPEIKFQEASPDTSRPTIAYLHTGGTLMMVPSRTKEGALSFENAIDIPEVIKVVDQMSNVRGAMNILGIFIENIDSKEVDPKIWQAIAATVKAIYDKVDGVVVGHGTHTLEYSSTAAAYALQQPAIPIVFTASQIPILGHRGSDGLPNLTGAMEIAAFGDIAEVVAYANGDIHRATRVTKANDSRMKVFESRVTGPIGYFTAGGVELMAGARRRAGKRKHELRFMPEFYPHVTAIKMQPGMNHEMVDLICNARTDIGLIIETYGSGAVPKKLVDVISRHVERGFPVYLSSSCGESGISDTMQGHDEDAIAAHKAGVRNVRDMSTSAATVKLMHVIGNNPGANLATVEEEMIGKSYAGEITLPTAQRREAY